MVASQVLARPDTGVATTLVTEPVSKIGPLLTVAVIRAALTVGAVFRASLETTRTTKLLLEMGRDAASPVTVTVRVGLIPSAAVTWPTAAVFPARSWTVPTRRTMGLALAARSAPMTRKTVFLRSGLLTLNHSAEAGATPSTVKSSGPIVPTLSLSFSVNSTRTVLLSDLMLALAASQSSPVFAEDRTGGVASMTKVKFWAPGVSGSLSNWASFPARSTTTTFHE